ncbi:DUF4349 domain-containing protein [Paenibacillus chitinolyticus]|uniref:DUF4349 domain-containing protein n=1 Tax=Paenibacillus chitinolyticus TaxID=79263 RepID=UPI002DBAACE3|nr:DUF4349 domain-containing protein [Paenibacillus chitinolyticus]MEC0246618.1 DUF4349 domain-containing protein [Paenibacillus chitinolyticus]
MKHSHPVRGRKQERDGGGKRDSFSIAKRGLIVALLIGASLTGCSAADKGTSTADQKSGAAATTSANTEMMKKEGAAKQVDGNNSASPAPAAVNPSATPAAADGFDRKVIYKGNLAAEVEDYAKAQKALRELVTASGAYILQFTEDNTASEIGGTFTIKVAAGGFASLLDGIEKISPTRQRNITGQDVTEEYVDLTSRLKAKEVVEARLLAFMEKATKSDELLAFSAELGKVQEEIERIKGRMRFLDQNVEYSTVELKLYQPKEGALLKGAGTPFGKQIGSTFTKSVDFMVMIFKGLVIFITALIPVAAIALVIGLPIYFLLRSRSKRRIRQAEAQKPAQASDDQPFEDDEVPVQQAEQQDPEKEK